MITSARIRGLGLVVALLASSTITSEAYAQPPDIPAELRREMPASVRQDLTLLEETLATRRGRLSLVKSSSATGTPAFCRVARAYSASGVQRLVQELQGQARDLARAASGTTSDDDPLVQYVLDSFPASPAAESSALARTCFSGVRVVFADTADGVFDRALALIRELRSLTTVRIPGIRVLSDPGEVFFVLRTRGGTGIGFENTTTTTLENVVRGIYTLVIQRDGYEPVRQEINLVRQTPSEIRCTLVPADQPGNSSCTY